MSFQILVNKDMQLILHDGKNEADVEELNWILKDAKLELWSQFYDILEYYESEPFIQPISNETYHIKQALESLEKVQS